MIVTLQLAPGSVVSEAELTARLGLGRTPVREAVQRLAQERLVDVFPRRGIQVTTVDALALGDLGEVRLQLESLAARLAAERATPSSELRSTGCWQSWPPPPATSVR